MRESFLGINDLRPKLGDVLKRIEKSRQVVIITSRSRPAGVLLSYEEYRRLMDIASQAKRAWLRETVARFRERAAAAGITEDDVEREIRSTRVAGRR